ncbi:MAG: Cys-Gln thioester bond-forming surface protein [Corynebacteriales bacterium]|nr:Cys-Gln thioester bond-forming surface protein [Mycobacteriales bacterium]
MRISTRGVLATLAVVATASMSLLGGTAVAAPVKGTYEGKTVAGESVKYIKTGSDKTSTSETHLFGVKLETGEKIDTYCIDVETRAKKGADYIEDDWKNYPGEGNFKANPKKVAWILHNSYPVKTDLAALALTSGAGTLSKEQAIAGTQLAIWHFSNGAKIADGNSAPVTKLYNFLTGPANTGVEEPKPSLELNPATATGEAGKLVGPIEVKSSVDKVTVALKDAPAGAKLVDEAGVEIKGDVTNGTKLFIQTPAEAGEATITAKAEAPVATGRLFRGTDPKNPTQTFIVAKGEKIKVNASAKASWTVTPVTPSPTPSETPAPSPSAPGEGGKDLPVTGSNTTGILVGSAVLIAAGAALVLVARRRRAASQA